MCGSANGGSTEADLNSLDVWKRRHEWEGKRLKMLHRLTLMLKLSDLAF